MKRILSLIPIVQDQEPALACPICGSVYVFPTSVRCNPAGVHRGEVQIENGGILWNPAVEPDGRGVRIELVFRCEAGHAFAYAMHFHKGNTFVSRNLTPTKPPNDIIWRT